MARANDVRAALALVERGEWPVGIVYSTDAAMSSKVRVVSTIPEKFYKPIVYPVAIVHGQDVPAALSFLSFLKSPEAKARLLPALMEGNRAKVLTAPVTAIFGNDSQFFELLPKLFPHTDAKSWFVGNDALIEATAFRNSSLQGAYFMLAARALGLDCGPMSGFDADKVNAAFFAGTNVKANFICSLGYGNPAALFPRSPRPEFADVCTIL